jgi:hypothetical protein
MTEQRLIFLRFDLSFLFLTFNFFEAWRNPFLHDFVLEITEPVPSVSEESRSSQWRKGMSLRAPERCVAISLAKFQTPKSNLQINSNIKIQSTKLFWSFRILCWVVSLWVVGAGLVPAHIVPTGKAGMNPATTSTFWGVKESLPSRFRAGDCGVCSEA